MNKNQIGIIKSWEIAESILSKSPKDRSDDEKRWLKWNGGKEYFKTVNWRTDEFINPNKPYEPNKKKAYENKRMIMVYLDEGDTVSALSECIKIIKDTLLWDLENKDDEDKNFFLEIKKEIEEIRKILDINFPIPVENFQNTIKKFKSNHKKWILHYQNKLALQKKEKERLKLIKRYKLTDDTSFEEVKSIEAGRIRKKLGIGEKVNIELSKELFNNIEKAIADVKGYLYIRRWKLSDGTQWFKIGITNNLERREYEQNVLPVAAETLASAKLASMDAARAIEKSIQKVIKKYQIKNSNNRELFKLKPEDLASIIDLFKKIDLRNK